MYIIIMSTMDMTNIIQVMHGLATNLMKMEFVFSAVTKKAENNP